MTSESARMTTAAAAKFRIEAPNSKPRAIKVIALDAPSERLVKELAQSRWNDATFFTASAFAGKPGRRERFSMTGWLSDLAGRTKDLIDEIDSADLILMIATAGENAEAAAIIGEACHVKHVMSTAVVLGSGSNSDETLSGTLAQLRPHVMMLVIPRADEYVVEMLAALHA